MRPADDPVAVARGSGVTLSARGRRLAVLAIPWCAGVVVAAAIAFDSMGTPYVAQPLAVRLGVIIVATGPLLAWWLSPMLGRAPGFRWLLAIPQPRAELTRDGMTIALPGQGTRRFAWEDIAGLEVSHDWRRLHGHGELRGTDGRTLARLPASLVYPRPGWTRSMTLAEMIVEARPDRYGIAAADGFGRSASVALRGQALGGPDPAIARRRRTMLLAGLLLFLVAVGVVGVVILVTQPA